MPVEQVANDIVDFSRKSVAKLLRELHREKSELIASDRLPNKLNVSKGLETIERAIAAAEKISRELE